MNDDPKPSTSPRVGVPQHSISGGGAVTVYLLHGAYGGGAYFDHVALALNAAGYRAVVWDAPGYGGTELPPDASIPMYADALSALLDATASTSNVVLGHSMGALIAPLACADDPRVDALSLSGASAGFAARSAEDQERYLAERLAPVEGGMSVADYAGPLIAQMMGPGASGPYVERVRTVILEMETATLASSIRAITQYDSRPALKRITVPTLLLAGTEDTACPLAGMQRIHDMVPDSELHPLQGVGHYGFAERPEEYLGHLLAFLGRHVPVGSKPDGVAEPPQ